MILENIKRLCKERNTSIFALEKALGIGNGVIGKWSKSSPTVEKLAAVADYFGVTVDELLQTDNQKGSDIMPRLARRLTAAEEKALERKQRDRDLTSLLEMYRNRKGIRSWEAFAEKAKIKGLQPKTLYNRILQPGKFKRDEIWDVVSALEIPDEVIRPYL